MVLIVAMGLYSRPDSPFWWMALERPSHRAIRKCTGVLVAGVTPEHAKEQKQLAAQIYATALGDLARRRFKLPIDRPTITFAAYRQWYLDNVSPTKKNLARERSMLKQLGRFFDPKNLDQLTKEDGLEWRRRRAEEVAPSTVNRELSLMKHMLGTAVPKYLEANPFARLPELPVDEGDVRLLTPAEEKRLLKAATREERALIICALDTLQRLSTVVALERAQYHGTYITVLRPKASGGSRPYKVPVSKRLRQAIDRLPKKSAFIFPSFQRYRRDDGPRNVDATRNAVVRRFEELCREAKIPLNRKAGGISFHCLRHTGASRMLNRGVDIKTVAEIGNWKDLNVLKKYLHPIGEAERRAVELVSRKVAS
jgi:integrase